MNDLGSTQTTDPRQSPIPGVAPEDVASDGARATSGQSPGTTPQRRGGRPVGSKDSRPRRKPATTQQVAEPAPAPKLRAPWSSELFPLPEGAPASDLQKWSEREGELGRPTRFKVKRWSEPAKAYASVRQYLGTYEIDAFPDEATFADTFGPGRWRVDLWCLRSDGNGGTTMEAHRVARVLIEDDEFEEEEEEEEEDDAPAQAAPRPPSPNVQHVPPQWIWNGTQYVVAPPGYQPPPPPPPPQPVWNGQQWTFPNQPHQASAGVGHTDIASMITRELVDANKATRAEERENARLQMEIQKQSFLAVLEVVKQSAVQPAQAAHASPVSTIGAMVTEIAQILPLVQPLLDKLYGGAQESALKEIGGKLVELVGTLGTEYIQVRAEQAGVAGPLDNDDDNTEDEPGTKVVDEPPAAATPTPNAAPAS